MSRPRIFALLVVAGLVLVGLSPSFGRAEPSGKYRPELPPAALENGCYPLPAGVRLSFPQQVRTDGDVETDAGPRRRLVLQYDLVGEQEVRDHLVADFSQAGFVRTPAEPGELTFTKAEIGSVTAAVTPFADAHSGSIVHGTVTLDLPSIPPMTDESVCSDSYSTKRFPPDVEQQE